MSAGTGPARAGGEHRLPAGMRLGTVSLQVADLQRSLDWYRAVLGLDVVAAGGAHAQLAPYGGGEPLIDLHERPGASPVPRQGRLGLYHYALLLPDRPALGRFLAHLASTAAGFGSADHLVSEATYLQDPDGLGIEVYADRPRASWRYIDGELAMATDPLDVPGVLRTAADEPWTGMPAGTVVGHLHLHVGDLRAAAALYEEALGLERTVWSYPGALFFAAGGYHHHLGVNTWARSAAPAGPDDARLLQWEIVLPTSPDAEQALASLAAAGHPVERAAGGGRVRDDWGTALLLRDEATH